MCTAPLSSTQRDISGLSDDLSIGNTNSRSEKEMDLPVFWESSDLICINTDLLSTLKCMKLSKATSHPFAYKDCVI